MTTYKKYWLFTLAGTLAVSFYPLYMGARVICDMLTKGSVSAEDFPKYIIPYTPISISVLVAVIAMPLILRYTKKLYFAVASSLSLGVFFITELLLESKVIVTSTVKTTLESWQMYMCYVPPEYYETRQWTAIDVLIGKYSPTFKLHFYLISAIIILAVINCVYGFAQMLRTGKATRCKALIVQAVCTAVFLGLCILACFTAFYRDGEITVSALSAFLMGLYFITLGVTAGTFTGSFLIGRKSCISVLLPSVVASLVTLSMYIGEMFLLSGHLYRLGSGFIFEGLPVITLAPIDLIIIILSGCISTLICYFLNRGKTQK